MDPISGLVIILLLAIGCTIIAFYYVVLTYILSAVLLWVVGLAMLIFGVISDYRYNKDVARNLAPYRLPFYYRWRGWRMGAPRPEMAGSGHKTGTIYDKNNRRMIAMYRPLPDQRRAAY